MISFLTNLFDNTSERSDIQLLANQLIESTYPAKQDEVDKLCKKVLQMRLTDYKSDDLIGLREMLHLFDRDQASLLDIKLMNLAEISGITQTTEIQKNTICRRIREQGWERYWGGYDEFIQLMDLGNSQDSKFLHTINQQLSSLNLTTRKLLKAIIFETPRADRKYLFNSCFEMFQKENTSLFLQIILKIDPSSRVDALKQARSLGIDEMSELTHQARFLKAMGNFSIKQRAIAVESMEFLRTKNCLGFFSMSDHAKVRLLETLEKTTKEECTDLFNYAKSLDIQNMSHMNQIRLLNSLQKLDKEERLDVVTQINFLYADGIINENDIPAILPFIAIIPKEERTRFTRNLKPFIPSMQTSPRPNYFLLFTHFYLLPNYLRSQKQLWLVGVDQMMQRAEYKATLLTSLEQKLSSTSSTPSMLFTLAYFTYKMMDKLQLHQEHPVVQRAFEIISLNSLPGIKNPFSLYKKLKELRLQPIDFLPQKQLLEGMLLSINMNRLQTMTSEVTIAKEDLPLNATLTAWNRLRSNLKAKIDQNRTLKAALKSHYSITWNEIWIQSLEDSYLSSLLDLPGKRVSLVEAKFKAVLSNILEKGTSPRKGLPFTEQEEVLIKAAMIIKNCPGGKQEGIDLIYGQLDPKYQYQIKLPESSEEDGKKNKAFQFINTVVKKFISDKFRGENPLLMQEIIGLQEIEQGPHQTIHVKNLISHFIGLDHEITFDRYTGVLYDSLINKTREEILTILFTHVTPETIAKELVRTVNSHLHENSTIVLPLIDGDIYWDLLDDLSLILNMKGAIKLLQESGFLQ